MSPDQAGWVAPDISCLSQPALHRLAVLPAPLLGPEDLAFGNRPVAPVRVTVKPKVKTACKTMPKPKANAGSGSVDGKADDHEEEDRVSLPDVDGKGDDHEEGDRVSLPDADGKLAGRPVPPTSSSAAGGCPEIMKGPTPTSPTPPSLPEYLIHTYFSMLQIRP